MISIVVRTDLNGGIGYQGDLLAEIPSEIDYFNKLTSGKVCIMGRKTYQTILDRKGEPLDDGRLNIVLTSRREYVSPSGNVIYTSDVDKILAITSATTSPEEEVMVIGGQQAYETFIDHADVIYVTTIMEEFEYVDAYFPIERLEDYTAVHSESFIDEITAFGYNITKYIKN